MNRPNDSRQSLYRVLLRHALVRLIFLYFIPLLLLTLFFHLQYRLIVRDTRDRHLMSLAEHQASMLDMFLGDRLLNLTNLADDPGLWRDPDVSDLEIRHEQLCRASEAFVDLSVLDGMGRVLGYSGPHSYLEKEVYAGQEWFIRLKTGGVSHIITDVYLGFRGQPHFTMALKLEAGGGTRILRAVLNPDKIRAHMASLEGAGEVHAAIVDRFGKVQVSSSSVPGFSTMGKIPAPGSERTGVGTFSGESGDTVYSWAWLSSVPWALVAVDATGGQGGLVGGGRQFSDIITNIWLFAALFCLLGGWVIILQARWVAREQYAALNKEREFSRQLMQASKLASVGELAAGVAHEINNPLAVVSEKAGLVKDLLDPAFGRTPTPSQLREHLDAIEKAVFRCTDITRNLLGFVRQEEVRLVERDLHVLIDDVAAGILGPELHVDDIRIEKEYDPKLGFIFTDPGQLRQVLFNLLKNAAEAVSTPGKITIRTRLNDDRFTLDVIDTGPGLSAEELEKVFMPFFTTKAPGKGTGLGLSVSYRIVKGLGGRMAVSSASGNGTTFTVDLPIRS
ncbi:MAG: hypothetical protein KOO60_02145 [Gemmatimonadales bacterium]|nr:hypothetical protein [Gemmatimonadales bacterium]